MKYTKTLGAALVLFLTLGGISGCGGLPYGDTIQEWFGFTPSTKVDGLTDEAHILAQDAQERMDADDYKGAAILWQQLKDQYPYSKFAALAELKLGDAYYLNGKYIEALAAYEDFERLHPENGAVPYALYQQGMCYYMKIHGIDRDQTPTIQTIQTLARLVEMYPDSKYAIMAQARIAEAQHTLAGHEFYIGEFYYNRKDYAAAMNRFRGLLQFYPDSGYHQQALNYISQYKQLVALGEVQDMENIRDQEYDSPFLAGAQSGDTNF